MFIDAWINIASHDIQHCHTHISLILANYQFFSIVSQVDFVTKGKQTIDKSNNIKILYGFMFLTILLKTAYALGPF